MEIAEALGFFVALFLSLEAGILMWARAALTSRESKKPLHQLMFRSSYRFFWVPKLVCGLVAIALWVFAYSLSDSPDSLTFGLVAIAMMALFCGLVLYEAMRTKE